MARLGYESVLIQGQPGPAPDVSPGFQLITALTPGDPVDAGLAVSAGTDGEANVASPRDRLLQRLAQAPLGLGPIAAATIGPLVRLASRVLRSAPVRVPRTLIYVAARYAATLRATYRALPEADLYLLHNPREFPAVWARARSRGVPIVYDAYDFYSVLNLDGRDRPPEVRAVDYFYNALERVCVRGASACFTVSDGVATLCDERFGRPFAVIRNTPDVRLDVEDVVPLRERFGLEDAFVAVIVGNAKGRGMALRESIAALRDLSDDVHLILLGRWYEPWMGVARELGVAERVHSPGPVGPTEVTAALKGLDAAIVPYWAATDNLVNVLPNGFFQPIVAGLPLLYPQLPELRRIAEQHSLGLAIDPENPASIASALRRLRDNPDERERLRVNAAAARSDLVWEADERRLAQLFAELLPIAGER